MSEKKQKRNIDQPGLKDHEIRGSQKAEKSPAKEFERLLKIMDTLREECPWDRVQTMESLRKLTIEETYELGDSVLKKDMNEIKGELGDLLLHIVFYAKIASETRSFNISDVIKAISDKLVYRHPHIYGDVHVIDANDVKENWEKLKLREGKKGVLSGVPMSLPALVKANRIQEKVQGVGFDWEDRADVWNKIDEELNELKTAMQDLAQNKSKENTEAVEEEFGDLFFSLINAARLYDTDPENSLERTNRKFIKRFNYIEQEATKKGRYINELSLDEMNVLWDEAKKITKNSPS